MLTTGTSSDPAIVRQVLSGDRSRFDILVQRYLPSVYAVAYARVGNHADAEDVAQETFLKAFTKLDSLREPSKVEGWLTTIARNVANTVLSKRRREKEAAGDAAECVPPTLSDAARNEIDELLHRHMENLDESPREVLMLHYFAGKSAGEIAMALGISRMAALKRLQRARKELSRGLLPALEGTLQPKRPYTDQAKKISSAVAAVGVAWQTGGAGVVAGGILGGLNFGVSGIATGCAGVGIAALLLMRFTGGDEAATPPESDDVQRSAGADGAIEIPSPIEEIESLDPVTAISEGPGDGDTARVAARESAALLIDLGLWRANMSMDSDQEATHDIPVPFRFRTQGGVLFIEAEDANGAPRPFMEGTISGNHVVSFFLSEWPATSAPPSFQGDFDGGRTQLTLTGILPAELSDSGTAGELTLTFTKLTDAYRNRLADIEKLKEELKQLYAALQIFRRTEGVYPASLAELIPEYIGGLDVFADEEQRQIAYVPGTGSRTEGAPQKSDFIGPDARAYEGLGIPDRYMKWEWALETWWNGSFLDGKAPVLSVSDSRLGVTVTVKPNGTIEETPLEETSSEENVSEAMLEAGREARRTSCQNNMKQLVLIIKMFQNEQEGEMTPPGWHSVYPEYLTDVSVLTDPGGQPRTFSYELIFPATMEVFFNELIAQVAGISFEEARGNFRQDVPIVIESGECNEFGGRNVAFLDGHVEFILHEDWDAVVGPYLAYR